MSNNPKSSHPESAINIPPAIRFVCYFQIVIGFLFLLQRCLSAISHFIFLFVLSIGVLFADDVLSQTITRSIDNTSNPYISVPRSIQATASKRNPKELKYPAFCVLDNVISNTPFGIFQLVQKKNGKTGVTCNDFTNQQFVTLSLSFPKIKTDPIRNDTQITDSVGVWIFTGFFPVVFDSSFSAIAGKTGTYFADVKAKAICLQGKVVARVKDKNLTLSISTRDGLEPVTCNEKDHTVLPQYQYDGNNGITDIAGHTVTKSDKNLWIEETSH